MNSARLILASTSPVRREILHRAGIGFEVCAPDVDEAEIKHNNKNKKPEKLVEMLALAKARAVLSKTNAHVIGADQVLVFNDQIFDKPKNRQDMRARLKTLRGKTHQLVGAVCVCGGAEADWTYISHSSMSMRTFSDEFLDQYMKQAGEDILYTVGGYMYEGLGVNLFEKTQGDYYSILGLSLLPLLAELRRRRVILS